MSKQPNGEGLERIAKDIEESLTKPDENADAPGAQEKQPFVRSAKEEHVAKFAAQVEKEMMLKLWREALRSSAESLLRALPVTNKEKMPELIRGVANRLDIDLRKTGYDADPKKMLRDLLEKELTPPAAQDEASRRHWRNDEEVVGKVIDAIAVLEEMIGSDSREADDRSEK